MLIIDPSTGRYIKSNQHLTITRDSREGQGSPRREGWRVGGGTAKPQDLTKVYNRIPGLLWILLQWATTLHHDDNDDGLQNDESEADLTTDLEYIHTDLTHYQMTIDPVY